MAYETLKTRPEFYDATSRTLFIDAVEWAGERMAQGLRGYLNFYERGPEEIIVMVKSDSRYSPFLALSRLQAEVCKRGLNSKISYHCNGFVPSEDPNQLVFNLDDLAEEFFWDNDIFK